MSKIVELSAVRRERALESVVQGLQDQLDQVLPVPEDFDWVVVERGEGGSATRWFQPRYRATIGTLPDRPGLLYLDYRHQTRLYECSVGELTLGLESGILPAEVVVTMPTPPTLRLVYGQVGRGGPDIED